MQEQIEAMYEMGESCRGISKVLDMNRRCVSNRLKAAGITIRPLYKQRKPHRYFNGKKYRKRKADGYWYSTTVPETYLHVDMWEYSVGPVPDKWHVHHENHNKNLNMVCNLKAMPRDKHGKHHHYKTRGD